MTGFWSSEEGRAHIAMRRSLSTVRLILDREPLSKRSAKRSQGRLQGFRQQLFDDAAMWRSEGSMGGWPRPRASIALDLSFTTTSHTPPGVDTICKWLLDELGSGSGTPLLYNDDRQVKLLWANLYDSSHLVTEEGREQQLRDEEIFFGVQRSAAAGSPKLPPPPTGGTYVEAQRVSEVFAIMRAALHLDRPWRPRYEERSSFGRFDGDDPFEDDDEVTDFYPENIQKWLVADRLIRRQRRVLIALDEAVGHMIGSYALERRRLQDRLPQTEWHLANVRASPASIHLGATPSLHFRSDDFQSELHQRVRTWVQEHGDLLPLHCAVGVTLLYCPAPTGKDLDNLIQLVLPEVLDTIRPLAIENRPAINAEARVGKSNRPRNARPRVAFVEAIALESTTLHSLKPGEAMLCLSDGRRHESWWSEANRFLEDTEQQ